MDFQYYGITAIVATAAIDIRDRDGPSDEHLAVANGDAAAAPPGEIRIGRLEAFSDGVFAIAITLLVLEITVPAGSEEDLLGAFFDQWRSYLAYAVSFATIGAMWLAHSAITDYLERANAMLVRLNLLLLMVVSFIPFPTRLLAEYGGEGEAGRVATTVYGLTILAGTLLTSALWRYAVGARTDASGCERRGDRVRTRPAHPRAGGLRRDDRPRAVPADRSPCSAIWRSRSSCSCRSICSAAARPERRAPARPDLALPSGDRYGLTISPRDHAGRLPEGAPRCPSLA